MLTVLIPVGIITGLGARPAPIVETGLTDVLGRSVRQSIGSSKSVQPIQLTGKILDLVVVVDPQGKAIQILNPLETDMPEALVYFVRERPDIAAQLPPSATLLGELGGTGSPVWTLPPDRRAGQGFVVVYSLGHREILAWGALELPRKSSDEKG